MIHISMSYFRVAQSTKLLMAFVIFLSFALQFYVPMEFITRVLKKRKSDKYENVIQVAIRISLVSVTGKLTYLLCPHYR